MKTALTTEGVIEAIRTHRGNLAAVGRAFGVTRVAVHQFVNRHPTCLAAAKEARETMKDTAESVLYRKVDEGSTQELLFYLRTQCRDRGYIERQEHDISITDKRPETMDDGELEQFIADLKAKVR